MEVEELLGLIKDWVYTEKTFNWWFVSEDYRIILGRAIHDKIESHVCYNLPFNTKQKTAQETLFGIPIIIDEIKHNRVEFVKVMRKKVIKSENSVVTTKKTNFEKIKEDLTIKQVLNIITR